MDFFNKTGKMAIGSRLRMLTDKITNDAERVNKAYGIDIRAKWIPVFFVLAQGEAKTITAIAREIGHSHPSVSNIAKEMSARGLVKEEKDKSDGRRNMVILSAKGKKMSAILAEECADMAAAVEEISSKARNDLWRAIEEWEFLLTEKPLFERVMAAKKLREAKDVEIAPFEARHKEAFKSLNEAWIRKYFHMEESDCKALDNPQENIIGKGGHILVALYKGEVAGVCALCKMDDPVYDYELSKLAVSPAVQGKGIGALLGRAAIGKAAELGAKKLYLESNTILEPAIHIYRKLGFKKIAGRETEYQRCNIQMELTLNK